MALGLSLVQSRALSDGSVAELARLISRLSELTVRANRSSKPSSAPFEMLELIAV